MCKFVQVYSSTLDGKGPYSYNINSLSYSGVRGGVGKRPHSFYKVLVASGGLLLLISQDFLDVLLPLLYLVYHFR